MGEYGPSVHDGKVRYLSASQLTSFDAASYGGCARRWWFKNVARKSERSTVATDVGTKVHAQIEHFLRTGESVLGEIARSGLRFLPQPGPDLLIEYGFGGLVSSADSTGPIASPLVSAGVPFVGRIDLIHARNEWIDDDGQLQASSNVTNDVDCVEVVDWKTTKKIADEFDEVTGVVIERGYAKSGEELAQTWQMIGYGVVGLSIWPSAKEVRASHGYFQTKGQREASKRTAVMGAQKVRTLWSSSEPLVEKVKSAAGEKSVEALPANYESCGAYGGCPHRSYCARDSRLILAEALGSRGGAMNLLQKIKADKEAAAKATTTTEPAKTAEPAAKAASSEVSAEIEALRREEAALKSRASVTPPDAPAPSKTAEQLPLGAKQPTPSASACSVCGKASSRQIQSSSGTALYCSTCDPQTTPAEIGPCPFVGGQVELTIHEVAAKKRACACGANVKIKPAEMGGKYFALLPKHDRPGTPAAPKAEPKISVVMKNDDGTKTPIEATPPAPSATPAPPPAVSPSPPAPAPAASASGLTLYLDSIEDGIAAQRLELYADKLAAALADQYKAADIRCAPEQSPLSFGKWKGALAAFARAEPPTPGSYAVSSSSEFGFVVFEALVSSAARVVRGVK